MRKLLIICAVAAFGLLVIAQAQAAKEITVGNKNFTEQYLVGQLMK